MRSPLHSPADQVFLHGSKPRTTVQTTHPHDHLRIQRNSGVLQRKRSPSLCGWAAEGGKLGVRGQFRAVPTFLVELTCTECFVDQALTVLRKC